MNPKNAGRKKTTGLYAAELGIPVRRLAKLGGEARLRAMSEEARATLLGQVRDGNSQTYRTGGLAARGYRPFLPGKISQHLIPPRVCMSGPIEMLMSDEDVNG